VRRAAGARALRRALSILVAALALGALAAVPAAAASRPPVVMIVLDEFPADSLLRPDGHIDARRFPGFASLARHSTWFPNASTVYDSTPDAVPAILTGRLPRPAQRPSYLSHPDSVFTLLAAHGYRVRSKEEATTVCPPRLCPRVRDYGNPRANILHRRRERLDATIRSLRRSRRPVFTFHHSVLPHVPWNYLPSGRLRAGYPAGTLPDFSSPSGFGDVFLTQSNQQRHLLQVGFVDREIGKLMTRLRRTGLLRRALLVVTADHGIAFQVGVGDRRQVTSGNIEQIAPVPMFIKAPGRTKGRVNRAFARTIDVLPTVARLTGVGVPAGLDGSDAFGARVRGRTGVRMISRDFSHDLTLPAAQLHSRRRLVRDAQARLLGTGAWAGVFRIGPHPDLIGRAVGSEAVAATGATASFSVPRGLSHVRTRAASAHTGASGRIGGGLPGQTRDLAVAVNGRIAAVGRSFHLDRDPQEYFQLGYPERSLHGGRNTVALYEVTGSGSGIRLARLGSAG
jgi:sulfatase-like protein